MIVDVSRDGMSGVHLGGRNAGAPGRRTGRARATSAHRRAARGLAEHLEPRALLSAVPLTAATFPISADTPSYWEMSADAQGNAVAVWQAYDAANRQHIYAQRITAAGVLDGPRIEVDADAPANGSSVPDVAVNASGQFVVVWEQVYTAGGKSAENVHARRYDATGAALGGAFLVSQTNSQQKWPTVAVDDQGDFVVAWMGPKTGLGPWHTFAQRFDASGAKAGKSFQVSGPAGGQYPSAAMDAAGNFVVAFEAPDGSGRGIGARRYTAAGAAVGGQLVVNATTVGDQKFPQAAMDADGEFIVAWSGGGAFARRFAASGAPGDELLVGPGGNEASVAMARDGSAVVAWSQYNAGQTSSVYARQVDAAGNVLGDPILVTTGTSVAVAAGPDFGFLVGWVQGGSDLGLFGQEYVQL